MRIELTLAILVALSSTASAEDQAILARPAEARQPFQDAEKHDLAGFWWSDFARGDLGGKQLKNIITEDATARVIIVANHTQAPNWVHLVRVARLIESNPAIESIWENTTAGRRSLDVGLTPFFAVLLEDKNGRFVGLLFLKSDKEQMAKVVSKEGVGLVRIAVDWKKGSTGLQMAKGGTTDQAQGPSTKALQPPIKLIELIVWRDGGSLGFKLSDAGGHHIAFCVDGGASSPTRGYFFLNVTHATQQGGQKLDLGGDTEKRLISYLRFWLETNFTQSQRTALLHQEKDVDKLTKAEFNAWHVMRLVENRAKAVQHIKELEESKQGDH